MEQIFSGQIALEPDATTSVAGTVELATDAETVTGTATDRVTTPASITAKMAAPGEIGGTTPAAGAFTDLSGTTVVIPDKTPVNAVASQGTITMSGIATADETFVVDSQTFTWKATRGGTGEVTIGADAPAAVTNIVTAITEDLATVTAVDGAGDTVVITAETKGVSGDSIVLTEASTNMAVDGTGTLGATTAGVDGTVGTANEIVQDASYVYVCLSTNTIADANWRRISVGSVY